MKAWRICLATTGPGDAILVPNSYRSTPYGFRISGQISAINQRARMKRLLSSWKKAIHSSGRPAEDVGVEFPPIPPRTSRGTGNSSSGSIAIARSIAIWSPDLVYAGFAYDGYVAPSILQVEGVKDIAVEFFSMSKS